MKTKNFFLIKFTFVILTITILIMPSIDYDAFAVPGSGILYGTDGNNGNLITIDPSTGVPSIIGFSFSGPSLAIDPVTGNMYASSIRNVSVLYSINSTTGEATEVGPLVNADAVPGLDYRSDGTLFGTANTQGMGAGGTGSEFPVGVTLI